MKLHLEIEVSDGITAGDLVRFKDELENVCSNHHGEDGLVQGVAWNDTAYATLIGLRDAVDKLGQLEMQTHALLHEVAVKLADD